MVEADLGDEEPLYCAVSPHPIDAAATLARVVQTLERGIALDEVVLHRVAAVREVPVLFASARSVAPARGGPPIEVHLAITPGADLAFHCLQQGPSSEASFERSVEFFSASLDDKQTPLTPQYSAIWQSNLSGTPCGYSWDRIYAAADGTMRKVTLDCLFWRLPSGELAAGDGLAATVHDRAGIARGTFIQSRGGKKAYSLDLQRTTGTEYTYKGESEGKPLAGHFVAQRALAGYYELLLQLQRHDAGGHSMHFHQDEFLTGVSLTGPTGVEYELDAQAGVLHVDSGQGPWTMDLKQSLPTASSATFGDQALKLQAVSQRSSLGATAGFTLGARVLAQETGPLPLAVERRGFETHVFADADQTPAPAPPPQLLSKVTYHAPLGENVAYVSPLRRGARRPAMVWIAGGFDWGIGAGAWAQASRDDDQSARALREAGLVLMLPSLRGSNANAGKNECFLGEVEDVLAASEYLAQREDVDPARIYLGGHSTGATLALLVAATSDRFAGVFAFGPVASVRQYGTDGCLPADASQAEIRLRSPAEFIHAIRTPTFVFEGALQGNAASFPALRAAASQRVHFDIVPALDHFSILAPGTETIARAILADHVDEAHLLIEP